MSDVTIHFDPEKADLLRRPLRFACWRAAEELSTATDGLAAINAKEENEDEKVAAEKMMLAAERVRFVLGLFDEIGYLPGRSLVDQLTADAKWLRDLIQDGFETATDSLETTASTDRLRIALEASEFYDALEEQLPPEPAMVEA